MSPTAKRVSVIATIPNASSLTGIAELEKDIFHVTVANVTGTQPTALGTNAVWRVDLRGLGVAVNGTVTNPAKTSLVAKIPTAGLLNGMTPLGRVLSLDVETKAYETVIEDETTAGRPERLVAVNGIRTHGNDLFYVNQVRNLFFKVPISMSTGRPVGPAEVLANGTVPFADDFALSQDAKRAWIALNSQNVIVEVDVAARTSTVIVNSTTLGEGSSVAVTGGPGSRSLYVTGSTVVGSASVGAVFRLDG
ncbi:hypothetical protein CkaCkLH20_12640 [Colletotrichum karsti]|uniref:SMP-30/Gluconolactonase/LRE-like region domain-containing protein n=1 Tax=Colletotrichum karsti TaxID=1095194 RepID=A0A9P6HX03_9PEZI|nr:uncharacterized protein CkaCkLH20_12640 [Colletotrichum karsti]KAF9869841.1 hypothetical protein CkaCkLH20_12640 [Colletotrichum karsti]